MGHTYYGIFTDKSFSYETNADNAWRSGILRSASNAAWNSGASDSIFLSAAGIPSYGAPGILYEANGGGIHGLYEHNRVSSLMKGRDHLYRLVQLCAAAS